MKFLLQLCNIRRHHVANLQHAPHQNMHDYYAVSVVSQRTGYISMKIMTGWFLRVLVQRQSLKRQHLVTMPPFQRIIATTHPLRGLFERLAMVNIMKISRSGPKPDLICQHLPFSGEILPLNLFPNPVSLCLKDADGTISLDLRGKPSNFTIR